MARWVGVVLLVSAGCRVTAVSPPPASCDPFFCGDFVDVSTSLDARAPLTAEECKALCGPFWCERTPIGSPPGCSLFKPIGQLPRVYCSGVVYDCGYDFGAQRPPCGPNTCSGCCDSAGTCSNAFGSCGGASCAECVGCTASACRALTACGGQLEAGPRRSSCADAGVDSSIDLTRWCAAACFESGAVAQVQCAERLGGTCADGGFEAQCAPDAGPPEPCVVRCSVDREACERACPQTSAGDCLACSASCGLTQARCAKSCPP